MQENSVINYATLGSIVFLFKELFTGMFTFGSKSVVLDNDW